MNKIDADATHFAIQARDRGIDSANMAGLFFWLREQIHRGGCERCERVMETDTGVFWRFHCADGIFYTVTDFGSCHPKTVYTQGMFSAARARHKRHRGSPRRKPKYRGNGKKIG